MKKDEKYKSPSLQQFTLTQIKRRDNELRSELGATEDKLKKRRICRELKVLEDMHRNHDYVRD